MRTFLIRLAVAGIAIPSVLWILHEDGWWLRGFVILLIALGCQEAGNLIRQSNYSGNTILCFITAMLVMSIGSPYSTTTWPALTMAFVIVTIAASSLRQKDPRSVFETATSAIFIGFWLGLGFGSLEALRQSIQTDGYRILLFLFANLWIGDTAAYVFGAWMGKRPLAPTISPKKTIAGAVAQIISSLVVSALFAVMGWISQSMIFALIAGLAIAVVGQAGDLFESCLKRMAGVKDSSSLLPGHGGVLDRFDSTLFAAPALWIIVMLWG